MTDKPLHYITYLLPCGCRIGASSGAEMCLIRHFLEAHPDRTADGPEIDIIRRSREDSERQKSERPRAILTNVLWCGCVVLTNLKTGAKHTRDFCKEHFLER